MELIRHSQAFLVTTIPLLLCDCVPPCFLTDIQTLSCSPLPHALGCTQPTIVSAARAKQLILQAMPKQNLPMLHFKTNKTSSLYTQQAPLAAPAPCPCSSKDIIRNTDMGTVPSRNEQLGHSEVWACT